MCYYLDYTCGVTHSQKIAQSSTNTHTYLLSFIENKFFIYALFDSPQKYMDCGMC